jgi:5,10-methylenetetrahydromethanopterin reductase
VRRLLAGDRSGYAGERFRLAPGAGLAYETLRPRVPLMIGTWSPRAAAYAATVADEVKLGGCANPDMVRLMRSWLGADGPRIVVGAVTVVDRDGAAARAHAEAQVQMYLEVVAQLDRTLELRPGQRPPLDRFVLAGTPDEVVEQALGLAAAGADRIEFGTPQGLTTAAGVDLLCGSVIPALREAALRSTAR